MTCKEKLIQDKPDWNERIRNKVLNSECPDYYGYLPKAKCLCFTPNSLVAASCSECWDQECETGEHPTQPTIKDSGDRTLFESGAVRDMREGKGRCDLMPLEVVTEYHAFANELADDILYRISEFKRTGYKETSWLYGAIHAFNIQCYGDEYTMFLDVAIHYEEGAKKYGPDNWQKGIPVYCYIDSAIRHYFKWKRGDKDEPHNRAFVWNLMCCIWEVDHRKTTVEEQME